MQILLQIDTGHPVQNTREVPVQNTREVPNIQKFWSLVSNSQKFGHW